VSIRQAVSYQPGAMSDEALAALDAELTALR